MNWSIGFSLFRKEEGKKNQLDFFIKKINQQSSFLPLY